MAFGRSSACSHLVRVPIVVQGCGTMLLLLVSVRYIIYLQILMVWVMQKSHALHHYHNSHVQIHLYCTVDPGLQVQGFLVISLSGFTAESTFSEYLCF